MSTNFQAVNYLDSACRVLVSSIKDDFKSIADKATVVLKTAESSEKSKPLVGSMGVLRENEYGLIKGICLPSLPVSRIIPTC